MQYLNEIKWKEIIMDSLSAILDKLVQIFV